VQVLLQVFRFSPVSIYHSTIAVHTHIAWGTRNMLT
jgi:hypothetical protein